ncbi:hypothetical protein [Phreatobacter sp.]|uniref:hypothetical protein n=1 Tax=Phreatobacter sp. TaxID=1966341 RepID=UPI0022BB826F|nr:hypothetical protein [Phreatobacter sp.]MCZ8316383.1 hypothetical protein [Phreatobacter sp.]
MTRRFSRFALLAVLASSGSLGGCMGGGDAPVASQAPAVQPVPVQQVQSSPLPATGGTVVAAVPATTVRPIAGPTRFETEGMRTAPGARESASLTNVSRVSTGAPTGGNPLGGTIVSGQSTSVIPTTVDRNREPTRVRSNVARDPTGPGTPPPIIAPELRDTTGRTIRNRQEVQF